MHRMVAAKGIGWLNILVCILISLKADGFNVSITLVENAVAKGAVCLDGSPPAYHIDKGFGVGINNWLVHFEGGGWCNNVTTCLARKITRLGSSKHMVKEVAFSAILSNKAKFNPDFYNWNRVKVRYCDGASFTGDVEKVDPVTNLHFRGARIWVAVIQDLLAKGMRNAENAILSGCSAGGLTSILHCDSFHALLTMGTKVKCLADAGYFINAKDVSGADHIQNFYNDVVTTHGAVKNLPLSCTSRMNASLCFFPQNLVQQIRTPIFILNAAYDSWQGRGKVLWQLTGLATFWLIWRARNRCVFYAVQLESSYVIDGIRKQIKNILVPGVADPHGHWHYCKLDIKNCSPEQLKTMQGFRMEFLHALTGVGTSLARGMFINSCYAHGQSETQDLWLSADSPRLNKTPIAKAVGDWFYDRSAFQKIDCPYPCDSSCRNRIFDPKGLVEE